MPLAEQRYLRAPMESFGKLDETNALMAPPS
jgi:hypothetical protein